MPGETLLVELDRGILVAGEQLGLGHDPYGGDVLRVGRHPLLHALDRVAGPGPTPRLVLRQHQFQVLAPRTGAAIGLQRVLVALLGHGEVALQPLDRGRFRRDALQPLQVGGGRLHLPALQGERGGDLQRHHVAGVGREQPVHGGEGCLGVAGGQVRARQVHRVLGLVGTQPHGIGQCRDRAGAVAGGEQHETAQVGDRRAARILLRRRIDDGLRPCGLAVAQLELGQSGSGVQRVGVVGHRLGEPALAAEPVAARAGRERGADGRGEVGRVEFQDTLEARAGIRRLALREVEARQVEQRARVVGTRLEDRHELFATRVALAGRGQRGGHEGLHRRVVLRPLQQRLALGGGGVPVALAEQRGNQLVLALVAAARTGRRHGAQHLDRAVVGARGGETGGDLELDVGRERRIRPRGRLCEIPQGLVAIAGREAQPSGHRQQRGMGVLGQRRLQALQREGRRLDPQARLGEQALRLHVVRLARHHAREVHLGLAVVALAQVHQAEQHARLPIVGLARQHALEQRAGLLDVARRQVDLGA